jgi:hypothetical protein
MIPLSETIIVYRLFCIIVYAGCEVALSSAGSQDPHSFLYITADMN